MDTILSMRDAVFPETHRALCGRIKRCIGFGRVNRMENATCHTERNKKKKTFCYRSSTLSQGHTLLLEGSEAYEHWGFGNSARQDLRWFAKSHTKEVGKKCFLIIDGERPSLRTHTGSSMAMPKDTMPIVDTCIGDGILLYSQC